MDICFNSISEILPQLITEYKNDKSRDFQSEDCELLLLSENRYFTFAIISEHDQFELLREYKQSDEENFAEFHEKVLEIDPNLKKNFRRVEIGISNKRLALVPGKIFNEGDSQHYLENSAPIWSSDQIMVDTIEQSEIKVVYAFRHSILSRYKHHFANAHTQNALTQYIKGLNKLLNKTTSEHNLFINALYDTMYVVLYRNEELIFANVYEFSTAEDFLYYVMLIFKEFQLDQDTTPTYISGKLDKDSIIHDLLMRYIRQLEFINTLSTDNLNIPGIPAHLYFDLFSLRS